MSHSRLSPLAGALLLACAAVLLGTPSLRAADAASAPGLPGLISHIKVLSNQIEDVSSLDAWKQSFLKDGMSDQDKALAVWKTVVKFRHQDDPPNEFLDPELNVHDPIKTFNVYGYGMCCCASSNVEALARYAGLPARGWGATAHSLPEVLYDGAWHMLDASLITYYLKDDKSIAGMADLSANPEGLVNQAHCPFADDQGWYPAATHNIKNSAKTYAKKGNTPFSYEYGYSQGYEVNVQLRPGESLTRNWSNQGLHVNMLEGNAPGALKDKVGKEDMRYAPQYGDLAPGRIGNGVRRYDAPLASAAFRAAALEATNLAATGEDQAAPALHVKDATQPGVLVLRMPSSYVYLTGTLTVKAALGDGGKIAIAFSDNNGLDWRDLATITAAGEQKFDLKPFVFRRYDYRLKFTITGKGTGLDALSIVHDVQHSQRALPALALGKNTITFSADAANSGGRGASGGAIGTITVEGSTNLGAAKGKQLLFTDFHPVAAGLEQDKILVGPTGKGSITFPIATPGPMTRLRFGCFYRARDAADGWDLQVSFDGGQTFKTIDRAAGPFQGCCKYVTVTDVPAGTKAALVRFAGTQRNTTMIHDFRIDADYAEPAGGFAPVQVTYVWTEAGQEKRDTHIARQPRESYTITCASKPVMKSLVVAWAE